MVDTNVKIIEELRGIFHKISLNRLWFYRLHHLPYQMNMVIHYDERHSLVLFYS